MKLAKLTTLYRLGPLNLARVAGYRLMLKARWPAALYQPGEAVKGPFFADRDIPRHDWAKWPRRSYPGVRLSPGEP